MIENLKKNRNPVKKRFTKTDWSILNRNASNTRKRENRAKKLRESLTELESVSLIHIDSNTRSIYRYITDSVKIGSLTN